MRMLSINVYLFDVALVFSVSISRGYRIFPTLLYFYFTLVGVVSSDVSCSSCTTSFPPCCPTYPQHSSVARYFRRIQLLVYVHMQLISQTSSAMLPLLIYLRNAPGNDIRIVLISDKYPKKSRYKCRMSTCIADPLE